MPAVAPGGLPDIDANVDAARVDACATKCCQAEA
jgi:hypothetical protein